MSFLEKLTLDFELILTWEIDYFFFLLWGLRSFETENGISVSENGEQKRYGDKPEEVSNVARGSYSFPHDGVTYTITWYADETGYHAEGAHLPTVPVV